MNKLGGKCSRTACNGRNARFYHRLLQQFYCTSCARRINNENRAELCSIERYNSIIEAVAKGLTSHGYGMSEEDVIGALKKLPPGFPLGSFFYTISRTAEKCGADRLGSISDAVRFGNPQRLLEEIENQ